MRIQRLGAAILASAATLGLGACSTYDDYGYGYGGVSVGTSYYDPYDDYWGYYSSNPYWGWYGDYYYPGGGNYVYDRYQRPYRWNDRQRHYWTQRRSYWNDRADRRDRREFRENWRDFRQDRREYQRDWRDQRRQPRRDNRRYRRD